MAKNIAVTGATGFIGGFVSRYLELRGYNIFRFGRKEGKEVNVWDITKGVYKNSLDIDCVVHCAALVDDWVPYKESYRANVLGTINTINSFPTASQFVYISSASVYDSFCKQVLIKERDCLSGKSLNAYSRTKLEGETEVQKASALSKVILRPHIVYGQGDKTIGPRIKGGIRLGRFPVIGNGKNRISFTHVENLAQAIERAIIVSKKGVSVYNVTDAEPKVFVEALAELKKLNALRFKEVFISRKVALVASVLLETFYRLLQIKKPPLITRYIVDQMSGDHILDISKAKEELGYHPTRNFKEDFLL